MRFGSIGGRRWEEGWNPYAVAGCSWQRWMEERDCCWKATGQVEDTIRSWGGARAMDMTSENSGHALTTRDVESCDGFAGPSTGRSSERLN